MRAAIAAVIILLSQALPAAAAQYLACKEGLLRCGQLLAPASNVGHVPARCDENEIRGIGHLASGWRDKIAGILNDERQIGVTSSNLAGRYSNYPFQSRYYANYAEAINGSGGLAEYLGALVRDLDRATRCIWDERYHRGGCRFISLGCYDRGNLEYRIRQANGAIGTLLNDIQYNSQALLEGLPDPYYRIPPSPQYLACAQDTPPCRLHQEYTVETFITAQRMLRDRCAP